MSDHANCSPADEKVFFLTDPPVPEVKLVFRPPRTTPNGVCVMVCPGGGYGILCSSYEGYEIADWLGGFGIAAAVLHYSVPGRHPEPLKQARKGMRILRRHAKELGIDPERIGIMGFSAGGHVASSEATHCQGPALEGEDPEELRIPCRPAFQILIYPVITMGAATHAGSRTKLLGENPDPALAEWMSGEKQVADDTPPAFVCHSVTDSVVPVENSRMYVQALRDHHVPVEYLELTEGDHGLGGSAGRLWKVWQKACLAWLIRNGLAVDPAADRK